MENVTPSGRIARFGAYELDLRSGELRKSGARIRLQGQPLSILTMLLERAGDVVTREELRDKLWPADTFVDFDHSVNTAVRKLRTALNDSAETPRYVETVSRHGYRFIAPVEWAAGRIPVVKTRLSRSVPWIAAGVVMMAIMAAASFYLRRPSPAPSPIQAIGVLPFANSDRESEYLSEGLAEALIEELSSAPDLRVVARTSAFRYKGQPLDPRTVGKQLNVAAVVTGRVQRVADQYQIHLELIDVDDGAQLWAKQYRARLADLSTLQQHVAADIAFRLGVSRADQGRLGKPSPAYDLYLRGRYHWNRRGRDHLLRAIEYFERAVQLDPEFALAYAGLGSAYGVMAGRGYMPGSEEALVRKSTAAINKALSLDDTVAEAYASRAAANSTYYWNFAAAERDFRRAIELKPSYAPAHLWYSEYLLHIGRFQESRREMDLAYQLDPFSEAINRFVCFHRLFERRYEESIAFCRRTDQIDPNLVPRDCLHWSQLLNGQYEDAIATVRTWSPADADKLAEAFRRGGREAYWKKRIEHLEREQSPYQIALGYAALGDRDHAFAHLNVAFEKRAPLLTYFYVDPRFDNLRSDPRFNELARRIGLPQVRGDSYAGQRTAMP